jgi:hypothetical protein
MRSKDLIDTNNNAIAVRAVVPKVMIVFVFITILVKCTVIEILNN